jgi:hypothetical protein
MLSVVVDSPHKMGVREVPLPVPAAGEVRVQVKYAGICGSDLHIFHGKNPFVSYPRIIGHEFVGRIESVGPGVDAVRLGETVAVDPVISCGHCHACSIGRRNVCRNLTVIGVHRDGGFSQYVCVPARNAYRIPAEIADTCAAIVEPFAVAANATSRTGVLPGDTALKNIKLQDIKPGSFVGTAAMTGTDGKLTATEVLVFPESARGTGEGHYAWDMGPSSTMTNANVDQVVQGTSGRDLKLSYKGGSNAVTVPENVPIVTFAPATRDDLKPGKQVFVVAAPAGAGFAAQRIVVEKDGVKPPM